MNKELERKIWISTIAIILVGLIALYSAAYENVRVSHKVFYYQLSWALLGILLMYFLGRIDYRRYYEASYPFYVFNVIILIAVLVSGRDALGARRWLEVGGLSFQPSELSKLSLILMLSRYFSDLRPILSFSFVSKTQMFWRNFFIPFFLTFLLGVLIFKQPDLGTSILLLGIFFVMIFINGLEYRYFVGFSILGILLLPLAWQILKPYQKDRLLVFLNPNIDPLGAGYTIIQSKIAIGSGEIFGKGWKAGTQNQLNFLPERHTDFIFSVIGEEWGFIGSLILIFCYFILIRTSLKTAERIKDKFGMLVATGIASILSLQVIINIGMVMGLFPVVGIPLPLVSYGRSSFLMFIIMIGILLNLSKKRTLF